MIVAPMRNADGVIGSLNLYRVDRNFDAEDLELVRLFTNHVAIALENATIHEQLIDAALTDPLTGLPNRRLFADRIEHALARRDRAQLTMASSSWISIASRWSMTAWVTPPVTRCCKPSGRLARLSARRRHGGETGRRRVRDSA